MIETRVLSSPYMEWAKTKRNVRFNLATSGVDNYPLARLPARIEDLEISGPSAYGYQPLQERLASRCGVSIDSVVASCGASMSNHLAMAILVKPGDEVLIEHPAYELLVSTAQYLGAIVKRFDRRFSAGFEVDPGEIERVISPATRLIVITNLHNPSSAQISDQTLVEIQNIARRNGARVLVDEIYLDADFEGNQKSAFHLGPEFVTTNSLTKIYGMSGLRCGWILAEPGLAARMWRLNDLFGSIPAHAAELLSCVALDHLDEVTAHSKQLLERNRMVLNSFLESRNDIEGGKLTMGTVSFPRIDSRDVDGFHSILREKYQTAVVPGSFFGLRDHIRIGIGGNAELLAQGLERIGAALDEVSRGKID